MFNTTNNMNRTERKVISVEKSPLYKQSEQSPSVVKEEPAPTTTPTTPTPPTLLIKEEAPPITTTTRQQKREEFSALEKARRMESSATEKLKKAEQLAKAYADNDIDAIAKLNNMSTTDWVRQINAKLIGTPINDNKASPISNIENNARSWQESMETQMKEVTRIQNENTKFSYINKNILPHLTKDPDKYEFIYDKGVDEVSELVHDFILNHFIETGGKEGGEELDPVELLDALEEKYMIEYKDLQSKASKFKKLQNSLSPIPTKVLPAEKEVAPTTDITDENYLSQNAPSNISGGPSRGTPGKVVKGVMQQNSGFIPTNSPNSREARLKRMEMERSLVINKLV